MSSSNPSASSSSSIRALISPEPDRSRRMITQESSVHHPNDGQQAQGLPENPMNQTQAVEQTALRSLRDSRTDMYEQTWPDFLQDHHTTQSMGDPSQDRRVSQSNVDRKRRLTNSAQNSGRVRTVSGGFHSRSQSSQTLEPEIPPSLGPPQPLLYDPTIQAPSRASTSGRVPGAVPLIRRQSSDTQRPMSTTREVILPKWQPDHEVAECPICLRMFTFWFRKHHCRKCGRVVCAGCSPHRITIPRQFIVHPPDSTHRTSIAARSNPVVIDLTGEASSPPQPDVPISWTSPRRTSNPGLGGGEEVRLCNPCVPDPQPSPQATIDLAEFLRQGSGRDEVERSPDRPRPSRLPHSDFGRPSLYGQHSPLDEARELRRQRGRGMIFQPDSGNLNAIQTRAEEIPDESLPAYGNFNYTVIPNYSRRDRPPHYHSNLGPTFSPPGYSSADASTGSLSSGPVLTPGPPLPGALPTQPHRSSLNHVPARVRYSSMDETRPPASMSNRPRVRSMLDVDPGFRRFMDQVSSSPSSRPLPSPRPRLQESDICPICRHALPPKGADGDETAREAHVMDCIASRDPAAPASPSSRGRSMAQAPPSAPIRMLPFTASEKDCVGEDGTTQECSICFVEYDVGIQLARLECLCKFHKTCIVEWFSRKPECPVHKVA